MSKIMEVTMEAITAIMEHKQTTGLFYHYDTVAEIYIAVDCTETGCYTAEFETEATCMLWLNSETRHFINLNSKLTNVEIIDLMTLAFMCLMERIEVQVVDKYDNQLKRSLVTSLYVDNTVVLCDCVHAEYHVGEILFPENVMDFMTELELTRVTV